jgi:WD40 repeat protein
MFWRFAVYTVASLAVVLIMGVASSDVSPPAGAVPLKGHSEAVYSLAFTPDGRYVVTGSFDHTLKVWDAATGKEVKSLGGSTGHQNLVLSVAISPDGSQIASGGSDNTAKIWDFPISAPLQQLTLADAAVAMALSPDGKTVAVSNKGGGLFTRATADGKPLQNMNCPAASIVAWTANGQYLSAAGSDGCVRFWTPGDGKLAGVVGAHTGAVTALANDPSNRSYFTAGEDGLLKTWSLPPVPSRALAAPHDGPVTAVMLSADNNTIISASADKTVRLSALANGQTVRSLAGPAASVVSVASAANNAYVAGGTADGKLFLWNPSDGKLIAQALAHSGSLTALAFHPNSSQLLTGGSDGLLKLWSLPIAPTQTLSHPDAVTASAVSIESKRLFTGSADKLVRSWNLANPQQPERQFSGHTGPVTAVATTRDGKMLASAGEDGFIRFWDQSNGRQSALIGAHAGAVTSLSFHANRNQVLSTSVDGSLKVWQTPPAEPKLFAHPDQVTAAALGPDGSKLVTGCTDKQVRLWNLDGGQVERTFPGNTLTVLSVAAGGNLIAAGGADKSLTIWNAGDGKEVKKFSGLPAPVRSVAVSPDGKLAAAGLADNSLRLFDLAMGKEVKSFAGHVGAVTALLFTANGDRLISASADKSVQVWNVVDGMAKLKLDAVDVANCLTLSKDGSRIAAGCSDKAVRIWSLADGKLAGAPIKTPADVLGVSFSPDASRLVAAGADGKARVYSTSGQLQELFAHDGSAIAATFLPDGKRIVTASADKTARTWTTSFVWQATCSGAVRQAVFSPKGDVVIAGGDDKVVSIWNAADGKPAKRAPAGDAAIAGIAVGADGSRFASIGTDKALNIYTGAEEKPLTISLPAAASAVSLSPNGLRVAAALAAPESGKTLVFDAITGKPVLTFADHTAAVTGLAFLGDNRTLVSAGADKAVRLSDVAVISVYEAHAGGVNAIAIHPNGSQVLSGGADKTLHIRDISTGKIAKTIGPLADPVAAVDWSRDGSLVAAATGKSARAWNAADGAEVATFNQPGAVTGVALSADKHRLATACADGRARIWDLTTKQEVQSFLHDGSVTAVAYHGNNTNLVTGSADKTVAVHAIQLTRTLPVSAKGIRALRVTANGLRLIAAGDDGKVLVINASNGAVERTIDIGKPVVAVAVSNPGTLLAAAAVDTVQIFNLNDGQRLGHFPASGIAHVEFSPDGKSLLAASSDNSARAWNVIYNPGQPLSEDFGKSIASLTHAAGVVDVGWMPDSSSFWSLGQDKVLRAWKFPSAAPTRNFGHPNLVDVVAFSPDGKILATGCHDGHVRFFDIAKNAMARDVKAHATPMQEAIYCLAWSPDGKQIASAGLDRSIKLWDASNGNLVREFKAYKEKEFEKGHRDGVFCVAFSTDGKMLASGSSDRSLKLWKVIDGSVIAELTNPAFKPGPLPGPPLAHPGWIYGVRFTADGKYLISSGGAPQNRGYLATWSLPDGKLISGDEMAGGTLFGLALAPDGKWLALGTAGRLPGQEPNVSFIIRLPAAVK